MLNQYLNLPRSIYVLCAGTFVNRAGTFLVPFLTIYLKDQLELGITFATTAMGVFGAGSIIGSVVGGHLTDRIGRKVVMIGAMFGGAAILLVFSVLTSAPTILLATFLFAAIGEMYRPAAQAMMADVTTPLERPHAFALMYVSINLGFAIAPFVGGIVAEYSFRWLFWGDAATSAIYGLIVLFALRETMQLAAPGVESGAAESAPADSDVATRGYARADQSADLGFRAALAHMLRNRTFVLLCVAAFLIAVTFMQAFSTFPLFLQTRGFGPAEYGRIIAVNGVLIVIGQLPLTVMTQRFSRGWLLVWAATLTALGFGATNFAFTEWQFMLTVIVWTSGEMLAAPLMGPIVSDLAPGALRGRYMGVLSVCFSGANMLAAPIGGQVLQHAGGGVVWYACAVSGLLAAGCYWVIRKRVNVAIVEAAKR